LKYRAEIDGLRAIAVIPVILFHAGFELFSGGYVGVDIFFVISGYLITTILVEDLNNNRFSLISFYERRSRRILPALYFMIIVNLIIGWFVLTPYFYRDLFQTTTATSLFASNFLLSMKSGYFARIAELKPFLHTWSLAVEEQYYLLFPLLLMFFWRFGRIFTLWLFIILFVISFLFGFSGLIHPNANFLLLPSRAWELLAGSIVAIFINKKGLPSNNFLATIGLLAIFFSIFVFDRSTIFPSFYTFMPVLGTMAVIVFANGTTLVAKILRYRMMVGIGLISYSLYLWHQPIFSFLKHLIFTKPTYFQNFIAMVLILFISFFSWQFIERPFRNKSRFTQKNVIIYSFLIITLSSMLGLLGHYKLGFPNRLGLETQAISEGAFDKNPNSFICDYMDHSNEINESCLLGVKDVSNSTIVLLGDSHADHLVQSFQNKLLMENLTAYNFSFKSCSPGEFISNTIDFKDNKCFEKISKFIKSKKDIDTVVVSFRWVTRLSGIGYGNFAEINSKIEDEKILKKRGEFIAKKLENLVGSDTRLIIVYPVPEAGEDVPNYTVKRRILGEKKFILQIPYNFFVQRNKYAYSALDLVSQPKEIIRVYPSSVFCDEVTGGYCKTIYNGKSLYYDDDHLSNYGASLLIPLIFEYLNNDLKISRD
jgi:peptidoglycan/LPS O-acetylase OafA/YrhL